MKHRIQIGIIGMFAIMMMFFMTPTVYADEYSSGSSATCTVTAKASTYTVSLPAVVNLHYDTSTNQYKSDYIVSAKGSLNNPFRVYVYPATTTFTMTGANTGETVTASVTQAKRYFANADHPAYNNQYVTIAAANWVDIQGAISTTITKADTYTGTFTFLYGIESTS